MNPYFVYSSKLQTNSTKTYGRQTGADHYVKLTSAWGHEIVMNDTQRVVKIPRIYAIPQDVKADYASRRIHLTHDR